MYFVSLASFDLLSTHILAQEFGFAPDATSCERSNIVIDMLDFKVCRVFIFPTSIRQSVWAGRLLKAIKGTNLTVAGKHAE